VLEILGLLDKKEKLVILFIKIEVVDHQLKDTCIRLNFMRFFRP